MVFACPTNEMSVAHESLSMTAATKTGPFLAFEAAMKAPSGDQLYCKLSPAHTAAVTYLSRRKKVERPELANGSATLEMSSQVSVFQILTVLSSDYKC
jgi:hypothetical protein